MIMNQIDNILKNQEMSKKYIDGKWVVARPENFKPKYTTLLFRLKEAWNVLLGRAETLYYYKQ
jgi:hypothetical protein